LILSRKAPSQASPDLSLYQIIQWGEDLASLDSFDDQGELLKTLLENHFGGEAFLCLKSSPKTINKIKSRPSFLVDSNSDGLKFIDFTNIVQHKEIDGIYWYLIPLLQGKDTFGEIVIKHENNLSQSTKDTLLAIGKVVGPPILATLQSQQQAWQQKQLALVRSVSAKISQITDLDTLTRQITKLTQETFHFYYVAVFLIDVDTQRLHFQASAGSEEGGRPDFERASHAGFALGEHLIGYVASSGLELIVNDVSKEPRYKEVETLEHTKSEAVLPLKVEDHILGVFDIQSDEINAFREEDLLVLRSLADNIAIAIESTRLYQSAKVKADQLATVSEVSSAITYIMDIDDLLQRVVDLIHERFKIPYVHLFTINPVQKKISFKAGSGTRTSFYQNAKITYDLQADKGIIPWTVQHGETQIINDVQNEPRYVKSPSMDHGTGSEMTIPLFFGGDILGVLDLQDEKKGAFSTADQQVMETLADSIAIAIRNARLYRSEKWRRRVSESLRDVAGLLSEHTGLEDVLDEILNQLQQNLPCDIASIWLFDPESTDDVPVETRELHLSACYTVEGYEKERLQNLTLTPKDLIKQALTSKQATVRESDDPLDPIASQFGITQEYSLIAVPLITGEDLLGVLTLFHHTPQRYGRETKNITSAFASYAAIAIRNTRLYSTSQEQAWISTILLQVATATQSLTNLDELVRTIVRLTPMMVGVQGCALFLSEPGQYQFALYAAHGIGNAFDELPLTKPLPINDAPIFEELLLTQEPLKVHDPKVDFNLPDLMSGQVEKDNLILLPLIARNELLGAFLIANEGQDSLIMDHDRVISEERYKIIQGIIQQTAVAVENIRLLEARQEEAYVSTVLLQAAQAVVSSPNLDDTLDSIVHIMPILVGIESSIIYLWDEDHECFYTSHAALSSSSDASNILETKYEQGDFPMLDAVFTNQRPIVYPFVENTLPPEDWDLALPDEGQVDPTPILQSRYPILMGFPLCVKEEVFGVLLAQDKNTAINRERRFELLWGIGQQASLAIQNDILNKEMLDRQRIEREFQLAREIQQTFLPDQMPEMPNWNMDVLWETARQVGGDFYDYFLLPDGRLAFVIADVSDKGLAASLYMTVTRTLLRAAALEFNAPAKTLEQVNERLLANSQNGLFITTFYGILSLPDGILTYTVAGHNPPLITRSKSKDVFVFEKGGIALGALPNIHLPERQITLHPGDCLVLYTDGVTEAFNAQGIMYGEDRLKDVLRSTMDQPATTVIETLQSDLAEFRGDAPLSDDTTILAIARNPQT
jgi:GAF domain-containing protein